MEYQTLTVAIADKVATVTLNRPDVRNAFNEFTIAELSLAWRVIHQADNPDTVLGAEFVELFDQGFRTDLGAQMQAVADLQRAFVSQAHDFMRKGAGIFAVTGIVRRWQAFFSQIHTRLFSFANWHQNG